MSTPRFPVGAPVRIRRAWPPGHVRAPWYLRGCAGEVHDIAGELGNPEELAYGRYDGPGLTVYRVRFRQGDVWTDYAGPPQDSVVVDIYENWLEPAGEEAA
ncbi:MAG: nitrile hydratase subunit beta [Proteobacteria bacterium]|nr:nitrile hydratase subunit beta [Pseudomonadota bacterium]